MKSKIFEIFCDLLIQSKLYKFDLNQIQIYIFFVTVGLFIKTGA